MKHKAILLIHGFAGGIYDMEALANNLEYYRNFDVFTFTLPGHDHIIDSKITKEDWLKAAEEQMEALISHGYKDIYLIGQSMGGLIASYLAVKYKQVKRLVLAAAAFEYLQFIDGNINITESLKLAPNIIKTYNPSDIISRILSQPVTAYKQFIDLSAMLKGIPKQITIPTLVIHGTKDEIVPVTSSEKIYQLINNKNKELVLLEDYTHDIFRGDKKDKPIKIVETFLKKYIVR